MNETRVIINGRFLLHRVTGVERYARELVAELDNLVQPGECIIAVPPETKDIPDYMNIHVVKVGKLHNRFWEHLSFPAYVRKQKGISLNLCNVAPLSFPGIVCIHDMKVKACPQYFNLRFLLWYNLLFLNETRRAKKIITVSEFSKKQICKYYSVSPDKVTVIYNAWQHFKRISYDENALKKYGLQKDNYFFSMCSLEPNKNFRWIAEAARNNPGLCFAVAGSINRSVFAASFDFACPDNMMLLGYVSDEEAKTLMRDCKAFLFPTKYEGFGIPPLEAISAGSKCVVVSDTEVMHELFGNAVIFVDPDNPHINLSQLGEITQEQKDNVLERFSWRKSAQQLNNILRQY